MKKLLTSQKFIQKTFISIIIVLLLSFSMPVKSQAGLGGMLLDPLFDLVGTLFDVVTGALQAFLVDGNWNNSDDGSIFNIFMVSKDAIGNYSELVASDTDTVYESNQFDASELDNNYYIPNMKYTPDKIFSGKIPALDINFVNPKDWGGDEQNKYSIAQTLHRTIASWYVSLRNLCVVGLMLVLLYVGIRIVISSTASDKSKYKQMLADWVVALCLLFTLHYIMTFTVTIIEQISETISGTLNSSGNNIVVQVSDGTNDIKFKTDLMGLMRFQMQYNTVLKKLAYMLLYIPMVCYTFIFTIKYLKRVVNIAILTLVSPLVALTYPIDKIRDGKAQAFDLWFKEYMFNALEQPLHLIIYTVFAGSYSELLSVNPLIAIVILASLTPAEKLLRKFFGFDKAGTTGTLGSFAGAVGGSAAYNAISKAISKKGGHGGSGGSGKNNIRDKKQLKDPNAPSGVDGFTDVPLASNKPEDTTQQRMLDAYDENNFGTNDYDPAEREAMAREAYQPESPNLSREEFAEQMRMSGYTDEEAEQLTREQYGETTSNSAQNTRPESEQTASQGTTQAPIHDVNEQQEKRGNRLKEGFKGAGKAIKSSASMTLGNKHWWRKVGRNTLRTGGRLAVGAVHTAGRVAMGVAGAAVGGAFGIAGDDLEDVLKFGAAGATLGASVGGNALNNTIDRIGRGVASSAPVQGFISGFTGNSSTDRALHNQEENLNTNSEFIESVQREYMPNGEELSGKELRQATERAAKLYNNGITDVSDIGKALKLEDSIIGNLDGSSLDEQAKITLARQQATTATKLAKQIQDPTKLTDEKYVQNLTDSYTRSIMKKSSLNEKDARQNAEQIMKMVKQFHKIS